MAGTNSNTHIKNCWSLLDFARMKGKMQVGNFVNRDTGEEFKSTIFTNPETGEKCFVGFSTKLGELTASQISAEKDDLEVVELESGSFVLCRKQDKKKECVMLQVITNNPFRVLGVYSNAKQADIIRNFGKMKAYLNVGREVSFPTDLGFQLGQIERTMDSVQRAQSDINLPKDKIRYALFWFCNGNSLDEVALNNLANQDIEKAVEILGKRTSYSSLLNLAVVAIIQGRYTDAVGYYSQLVHDFTNRSQFIESVCGETFQIDEDELMHIVIDELLTVTKPLSLRNSLTVQSDITYASEKALSEPLAKINSEIAKAKAVPGSDAAASLKAGRALIRNTKVALSTVKSLAGASNMQFQSAADNLAKQILQCGINYFNNTDDDNDVDTALELQQYALDVAVGKLVKDRCKQNVDILLKKKEQAAYDNDLAAIATELKSFQSATPSISRAESFVRNCKPHLNVLKQNLGVNNDLYIKISSAVANNALGMLIRVVNEAQESYSIEYGVLTGTLSDTISEAISAMSLIGSLDMSSQERSHFNKNNATLVNLSSQLSTRGKRVGGYRPDPSPFGPSGVEKTSDTVWGWIISVIIVELIWGIIASATGEGEFWEGMLCGLIFWIVFPINIAVAYGIMWIIDKIRGV